MPMVTKQHYKGGQWRSIRDFQSDLLKNVMNRRDFTCSHVPELNWHVLFFKKFCRHPISSVPFVGNSYKVNVSHVLHSMLYTAKHIIPDWYAQGGGSPWAPPPPFPRGVLRQIDYIQELLSLLFLLARTAGGSKHNSMNCHKNMQISPERNAFSGCTAAAAKFPYSFPYRSFTFQRNPRAGLDHDKECVTYYPSVGCTLKKSMLRVTPPPNLYSKCLLLKHVQHERMAAFDARSLKT